MTKIDILSAGVGFLTKWCPFFIFSLTHVLCCMYVLP